jgi:peptidoglycan/LPS O-acetylase OafA/YrhL
MSIMPQSPRPPHAPPDGHAGGLVARSTHTTLKTRIPTLDGLRGCAVLLVLVHHYIGMGPLLDAPPGAFASEVRAVLTLAPTGVDLFFVLSGFLIGGILLDHRDSPQLMRTFYVRRFLRIIPVAWLCILLSIVIHHVSADGSAPSIPWWVGFTFTTNFFLAHANGWVQSPITAQWTLAIEEQFYLFFPWVVRGWPRRSLIWLGPVLILGSLLARTLLFIFAPGHPFACAFLTFCRLDSLGTGFAAACLVRSTRWPAVRENRRLLWGGLLFFSLGFAVLLKEQYRAPGMWLTWGYTVVALFYGILLLLAYQPRERWLGSFFQAGWLQLYGRYSYFIYLFQVLLARPLVMLIFHGRWADTTLFTWPENIAAMLVMLIPATLSWYLLEAPLLRFGKRWQYEQATLP